MTLAPCHTVRRPEVEGVTTATLEFGTVMLDMAHEPLLIAIGIPVRDRRIWTVTTCTNISEADLDMGGGLVTILIEPEGGGEDLKGEMRVESTGDLGDMRKVAVDETSSTIDIFRRTTTTAASDVEATLRKTEVLLHIDQEEMDSLAISGRGSKAMLRTPLRGTTREELLIGGVLPTLRIQRIVELGDRQLAAQYWTRHHLLRIDYSARKEGVGSANQ